MTGTDTTPAPPAVDHAAAIRGCLRDIDQHADHSPAKVRAICAEIGQHTDALAAEVARLTARCERQRRLLRILGASPVDYDEFHAAFEACRAHGDLADDGADGIA